MKLRVFSTIILLLTGMRFNSLAQGIEEIDIEKSSQEEKITSGDNYFAQNQYHLSLLVWNSLLKDHPDDVRFNYMAANCLLHIRGSRGEALPYLRKIEPHIGKKVKINTRHTYEVPLDGHFLLGQALHHTGNIDEAITQFDLYLNKGGNSVSSSDKKETLHWIQWCKNAKEMLANPDTSIVIKNIGKAINTTADEYSPALSLDESVMYFTSRRLRSDSSNANVKTDEMGTYYEDVYFSIGGTDGHWAQPELVEFEGHKLDENEASVSVSADGSTVYIYMDRSGGGDIFRSDFIDEGMYSQVENLRGDICSDHWETHCSITPDANMLFFTSNRPGGYGGLDIYRVIRLPNGEWGKAEVLPPPINTPFDEDSPFIHSSGKYLYYSSNCDKSIGEYDIFYTEILEGQPLKFSEPVHMPIPINTFENDLFFSMGASGERGYYSSSQQGSFGGQDIFIINFKPPMASQVAVIKGHIKTEDGSKLPDNFNIVVSDGSGSKPLVFKPRAHDGAFIMALEPCREYLLKYLAGEIALKEEDLKIPCGANYAEIQKELLMDTIYLKNILNTLTNTSNTPDTSKTNKVTDPSSFEVYFGYNKNTTDGKKEYRDFLKAVHQQIITKGKVSLYIEASASQVPTTTFSSNEALAVLRANNFKKQLLLDLKKLGVKEESVQFNSVKTLVQGPAYANDGITNSKVYQKFQYIKAKAE